MDEQLTTTLKAMRALRDLTQADLASLAGITRKSVNAIETGNMVPSIILALKLARALHCDVGALFSIATTPAQ